MVAGFDISEDFAQITDWLKPVAVDGVMVQNSLRRAIRSKEAAASGGKYTTSDVMFHLDRAEIDERPLFGRSIMDEDGCWTILGVDLETLANRWKCTCRQLKIECPCMVSIQRASFAKSQSGAMEPTWTTIAEDVPAKIEIESTEIEADRSNRTLRQNAFVYFAQDQGLQPADRIIDGQVTLKVISWDGIDSIEQLFRARCEVSKWPQS